MVVSPQYGTHLTNRESFFPRVAVVQLGGRRRYAVAVGLDAEGALDGLYTDLHAEDPFARLLLATVPRVCFPAGLKRLASRAPTGMNPRRVHSFPLYGLWRRWGRAGVDGQDANYDRWIRANRRFGRLVARRGLGAANVAYCFNGAALEVFEWARDAGLRTVLDQTSAAAAEEERLLAEERARWVGWEEGPVVSAGAERMAERERAEWDLADVIVCGSSYVRDSVERAGGPTGRCVVVTYGTGEATRATPKARPSQGPLRVLFAGTVCLRKGVPYLWEAARALRGSNVHFRIVGHVAVTRAARAQLCEHARLDGALPRAQMARVYESADVLLLPSISEGSANVTYEAMAHGLPVVTTPHAGSVVRDGVDGFVVPIRSCEGIVQALIRLEEDHDLLATMSGNARRRAGEFTLGGYGRRLVEVITSDCRGSGSIESAGVPSSSQSK